MYLIKQKLKQIFDLIIKNIELPLVFIISFLLLLSTSGRTIWAIIASYMLYAHGIEGQAEITEVTFVPPRATSMSSDTTYISWVKFQNQHKAFLGSEALGLKGDFITVHYLHDFPNLFIPYGKNTSYLDVITTLAPFAGKVTVSDLIMHFLIFGGLTLVFTISLGRLWFRYMLPLLKLAGSHLDTKIYIAISRMTVQMRLLRNFLFTILLYFLISLAFAEITISLFSILLKDDVWIPVIVGVYVFIGGAILIAIVHIASIFKKDKVFPNLQEMLKEVIMISTLLGAIGIGVCEWRKIIAGGQSDIIDYLVRIGKLIFFE